MLGAFIADSFAGRLWTFTYASIFYQIVNFPFFMQLFVIIIGCKSGPGWVTSHNMFL
ncbi:hypothetical protein Hanom_Chr00s130474g01815161 [Helianthus anomalus]